MQNARLKILQGCFIQVLLDGYKKDGAEPDTSSEKRISELEAQIEALKKMLEASSK